MRLTASRRARAPNVSPSSTSSPAACTAVPTRSVPLGGLGGRFGEGRLVAASVAAEGRTPAGLRRADVTRGVFAVARAAGLAGAAARFARRSAVGFADGVRLALDAAPSPPARRRLGR